MLFFNYMIIAIPIKCMDVVYLWGQGPTVGPALAGLFPCSQLMFFHVARRLDLVGSPRRHPSGRGRWEAHVSLHRQAQSQELRCQHNLQKEIPRAGASPASTELWPPDLLHESACGNTWYIFTEAERCQWIKQRLSRRERTILVLQEAEKHSNIELALTSVSAAEFFIRWRSNAFN